jgi:RNA polymerase sigma factor (sigma-70 family)
LTEAEQNRLIIDGMAIVTSVAGDYRGRGVDFDDLLAIGREGLTLAARSYDPSFETKFSTWATDKVRYQIVNEMKAGRHHGPREQAQAWGDEHSEVVHDWTSWGNGGNARAIYEMWPDEFDGSSESLSVMFDEIRDKQERFQAAFISLKPQQRKLVTLVYLRDPAMTIERAAREMRISYLKAWRMTKRALTTMRDVISAMESEKKPLLRAA